MLELGNLPISLLWMFKGMALMTQLAKEGEKLHLLEERPSAPELPFISSHLQGSAYAHLISLPFSESHHISESYIVV